MLQLSKEDQLKRSRDILKRKAAAEDAIKKIEDASMAAWNLKFAEHENKPKHVYNEKEYKDIQYLLRRMEELNLSYRLVFNLSWVEERQIADINALQINLADATIAEDRKAQMRQNLQAKEYGRKHKPCGGKGFTGYLTTSGELNLCSCVKDLSRIIYYR